MFSGSQPLQICRWISRNISVLILVIVQRDATQSSLFIILKFHSTCFGCQPHPSSGVHITVTTASGTATSLERGQASLTTVLCTPDDGCGWHPKRVEWTCRI